MIFLARGIEDHHYWVVQDVDGALIETPWRIEREAGEYRLSHADDSAQTARVFNLGAFESPEDAVERLREFL